MKITYPPEMLPSPDEGDTAEVIVMEICAECGKPIEMGQPSYYSKHPDDDIGQSFHGGCGSKRIGTAPVEGGRSGSADTGRHGTGAHTEGLSKESQLALLRTDANDFAALKAENDRLSSVNADMLAALKPFAAFALAREDTWKDQPDDTSYFGKKPVGYGTVIQVIHRSGNISIGDFRRARAILTKATGATP